jgi:hypothetical protein
LPSFDRARRNGNNLLEMKMALYLSFLNLITNAPLLDRLTTALRRDRNRRPRQILLSQSGQAPPRRLRGGLWAYRIQSLRLNDLSPHLRRDIGLDG